MSKTVIGSELLLRHADALRCIEDCKQLRLIILGLDFYVKRGNKIVQVSSADYSSISGQADAVERSGAAARQLIQNGLPDGASLVSFVLKQTMAEP